MTTTSFYDIPLIEPNQSNKHITANFGFETLAVKLHAVETGSGAPYDVPIFIPDKPTASMVCARIAAVRAFSLPINLTGSIASAGAAATASTVFSIQKGTTQVGTVTFGIGATTGTFAMASATAFAASDILRVVAPATPDTTLADISITFAGART